MIVHAVQGSNVDMEAFAASAGAVCDCRLASNILLLESALIHGESFNPSHLGCEWKICWID